jgi:hypothetical protein
MSYIELEICDYCGDEYPAEENQIEIIKGDPTCLKCKTKHEETEERELQEAEDDELPIWLYNKQEEIFKGYYND